MVRFIFSLMLVLFWSVDTLAQQNIKQIEKEIVDRKQRQETLNEQAREITGEIDRLRKTLRALSTDLDKLTRDQIQLENRLGELEQTEGILAQKLTAEQKSLVQALAALSALRKDPPPAFATHPEDALRAVQGSIALASVVPALRDRAETLRAQLSELSAIRRRIDKDRADLAAAVQKSAAMRDQINTVLSKRQKAERGLRSELDTQTAQINKLVEQAQTLRELSRQLARRQRAAQQRAKEDGRKSPFAAARGLVPLPVLGQVVTQFGDVSATGQKALGVDIKTRAGAQITIPFDGQILYAGPFRKYGQILILGIDERYQILLAGIGQVHGFAGQDVLAGETIGFMAEKGDEQDRGQLYMELRDNGKPIDPAPWLLMNNQRAMR